ncbi:MAG: AMP-binding protein, partial [Microthrixaceae bacterium]|nr:AMP-binding protein [Microthrixaceae bacterium]
MTAVGTLLLELSESDRPALLYGDRSWSYRELVAEGRRRAAWFESVRDPQRPPHIGVLLDNVPDYLFWLTGAALSGSVIVGINATYRGEQLGQLVEYTDCQAIVTSSNLVGGGDEYTDCQAIVTSSNLVGLLDDVDTAVAPEMRL